eukprot:scaffold2436_cov249-Pinguiococcus_pyrenoidosus.AAC.10
MAFTRSKSSKLRSSGSDSGPSVDVRMSVSSPLDRVSDSSAAVVWASSSSLRARFRRAGVCRLIARLCVLRTPRRPSRRASTAALSRRGTDDMALGDTAICSAPSQTKSAGNPESAGLGWGTTRAQLIRRLHLSVTPKRRRRIGIHSGVFGVRRRAPLGLSSRQTFPYTSACLLGIGDK